MSRHSRQPSTDSIEHDEDPSINDQNDDEELERQRQEELDAAKAELFGPRPTAATSNQPEEDDQLDLDDLANFDLGDLDLTTNQANNQEIDFDEIDDDLLSFSSDPLVKEALNQGVDLRIYSQKLCSDLTDSESQLLSSYLVKSTELAELHSNLMAADSVLRQFEDLLISFKSELGTTADEIAIMQEKSMNMSTKLDNRTLAQRELTKFVSQVYLPPSINSKLIDGEVDEDYAIAVSTLDTYLTNMRTRSLKQFSNQPIKALEEVLPSIERTQKVAIQKIKQYLSSRFNEFTDRSNNQSIDAIQRSILPYSSLYTFLLRHSSLDPKHPDKSVDQTAEEIRTNYAEQASKALANKWKRYFDQLKKYCSAPLIEAHDLIGNESINQSNTPKSGLFSKKPVVQNEARPVFSLSDRDSALSMKRCTEETVEQTRSAAVSQSINQRPSFEKLWRIGCDLIVDSGVKEYDFVVGFFGEKEDQSSETTKPANNQSTNGSANPSSNPSSPRAQLQERGRTGISNSSRDSMLFIQILQKPAAIVQESLDAFLRDCTDPLTLLTLIRVAHLSLVHLHSQSIYMLDFLFERFSMTIGLKFKHVCEANMESIKQIPSIGPDQQMIKQSKNPYPLLAQIPPVVIKFTDFTCSCLALCLDANEEQVNVYLRKLRNEFDRLVNRSSIKLTNSRHQLVFTANLYHFIAQTISQRLPSCQHDEALFWRELFTGQIRMWSEEELMERFRFITVFSKQFGMLLEENSHTPAGYEQNIQWEAVEAAIKQFSKSWREAIESLANACVKEFGPPTGETSTTAQFAQFAMVTFLQNYSKFFELMKRYGRQRPVVAREIVPINVVVQEVRKYARIQ